jgi:hypothetical protein
MKKILKFNTLCENRKPENFESKINLILEKLLKGKTLNRKNLEQQMKNTSLHSVISSLRNEKYIPIESKRQEDSTSDYNMIQEEIMRYKNPELRKQQKLEMREQIQSKRTERMNKQLSNFLNQLQKNNELLDLTPASSLHVTSETLLALINELKSNS